MQQGNFNLIVRSPHFRTNSYSSVRVSNELGRGDSRAAKFAILIIALTSFAIALFLFVNFMLFRENLAYLFTKSHEVATAVAHLSPLLAFSLLLNGVQPVLSGELSIYVSKSNLLME